MEHLADAATRSPLATSGFAPDLAAFYDGDPEAAFARLRAEDPVHWYEPGGFWCLTRQEEIREVSRNPLTYSSAHGTQMFQIPIVQAGGELPAAGADGAVTILEMDPPDHQRHRRLVMSVFTPRYIRHLESRIRAITQSSLDACEPGVEIDFVEQVAVPLPMQVIAEMIGLAPEHAASFRRWSDSIVEAGGGGLTDASINDLAQLYEYLSTSLAEHQISPRDDIISLLQRADIDGERLTEGEILVFVMTLLVAGNETTRNVISGAGRALAEHPEQRAWLVEDPARISGAVEEMLRWVSPVRSFVRCAQNDVTLGGRSIRTGDHVVMFYGSANRDEAVFGPSAGQFDVSRANANRHLAFGFGEHVCLGAALARIEIRIMFEELLARWPGYQLTGDAVPLSSCLMNGVVHLPVRLVPATQPAAHRTVDTSPTI